MQGSGAIWSHVGGNVTRKAHTTAEAAKTITAAQIVGGNVMRKVHTAAEAAKTITAAQIAMRKILDCELNAVRESGTWKNERIIVTSQGPSICVDGRQQPVLNFCANNYLGLSVSSYCLLCANIELLYVVYTYHVMLIALF